MVKKRSVWYSNAIYPIMRKFNVATIEKIVYL